MTKKPLTPEQKLEVAKLKNTIIVNCFYLLCIQHDFFQSKSKILLTECKKVEARLKKQCKELQELTGVNLKELYRP